MVAEANISYYSVTRNGKALYTYSNGDQETEKLASLCLKMAPSRHRWYFHTAAKTTIGFLFDDGHVYFAISKDGVVDSAAISKFLHRFRDDFRRTTPVLRSLSLQQQRIHPIGPRLGGALEKVNSLPSYLGNRQFDGSFSMDAPLLGISRNQEKRREESEYHLLVIEQGASCSTSSRSSEEVVEVKSRSDTFEIESGFVLKRRESSTFRSIWCRLVGIVVAIKSALGAALVILWLRICGGAPGIP